ncbi:hypothetical protein [Saccharothrix sp. Mg75]|uniref:hypothetical protein n=1 Tax=Saccharothrix sp. Mg75 TaxID=3445357 RepID=UPI003EEF741A
MTANGTATGEPGLTVKAPPRSVFQHRRYLLPLAVSAVTALVGVVLMISSGTVALPFRQVLVVRSMMASKVVFFQDEQVRRILLRHGLEVHVTDSTGSLEIIRDKQERVREYDFVLPSGQAAGKLIHDKWGGRVYYPFASPLVLGAFGDYAEALVRHGVATRQDGGDGLYYDLRLTEFVRLALPGDGTAPTTWADLGVPNRNQVVAQTPSPCDSYSGAAWLGLVAFTVNGSVALTEADVHAVAQRVKPVFDVEGMHGSGIGTTFFHPDGRSTTPVGVMYEHQYLAYQLGRLARGLERDRDRVVLYPDANHRTEPWLIAFTPAGELIGDLLEDDAGLRQRALELGLRPSSRTSTELADLLASRGLPVGALVDTEGYLPKSAELTSLISEVGRCPHIDVPI